MTKYLITKKLLLEDSLVLKSEFADDLPAIRQGINDYADFLMKEYELSVQEQNMLANYSCKLHPKDK